MLSSIANPASATQIGTRVKAKRCRSLSEKKAMHMENPNAAAHGGIEYNCVVIAEEAS